MGKVIYTCKKCGWKAELSELWKDIRPKSCPNKKCGTNFRLAPDSLDVRIVSDVVPVAVPIVKKPSKKKK